MVVLAWLVLTREGIELRDRIATAFGESIRADTQ